MKTSLIRSSNLSNENSRKDTLHVKNSMFRIHLIDINIYLLIYCQESFLIFPFHNLDRSDSAGTTRTTRRETSCGESCDANSRLSKFYISLYYFS